MRYWLNTFSTGYVDPQTNQPGITAAQSSEIVSLLSAGTFFGALTAAPTVDFFGRKYGLIVSIGVFCVGVILQTAATAIPLFVAGRFFAGYGVGMISAAVPLYQSECAPKWIRGSIVGSCKLVEEKELEIHQFFEADPLPRPAGYHNRSAPRIHCWKCHEEPHGYRLLPYPYCRPVRLGNHPGRWNAVPARDSSYVHQTRKA